ncbi:MAG: adenosylcobinamide-GDP ribazoletransferase [Conexivisphaera sp.]|jgi:adenosylcobinamide-GDP ribazoletransferase|nr:adenosylcobinamide-GDP ribazoletransferase [Conexivisphaerales archaeon]
MERNDPLRGIAALLGFLTIIPSRGSQQEAARHFYAVPVVGFVRGMITSISVLALAWFPPYVAAALALALHYVGQGFMHADGFSDFSEALIASKSGTDPRAVVHDTHRGSFAIAAFSVLSIVLFASSLYALSSRFVLAFVAAEIGEVIAIAAALQFGGREPYDGMASAFKEHMSGGTLGFIALLSAVLIFLLGGGMLTILVPVASLVVGGLTAKAADRTLGFTNGDALGFAGEIAFAAALLMVAHA